MTLHAIEVFRDLEDGDIRFLKDLEKASKRFKWVPEDRLSIITEMPLQDARYRLSRLNEFELVERGVSKYAGYKILPSGFDVLAIWDLVNQDVLEAFGKALGVGKEADIYDALTPSEETVAVKFNRLGLTFTSVKKKRSYEPEREWIDASKSAAKKEFRVLKKIHPEVSVPEPVAQNRHVLVTGLIEGDELANVADIDLPEPVLDEILANVLDAYKLGVIHGDLSEHNVIIKPDGVVLIIDWPQWVSTNHDEANELLERDVNNILKYFRRKFGIERDLNETLKEIKS
ncbi:MAG: phosphotransferase [Hadesarchaea archaeon]|nr:phosphotransferase [Hadesarchaea archaeon]